MDKITKKKHNKSKKNKSKKYNKLKNILRQNDDDLNDDDLNDDLNDDDLNDDNLNDIVIVSSDSEDEINNNKITNMTISNNLKKDEHDKKISPEPKYKNLVLSGGSLKGISEVGAVKKLIEEGLLDLKKLKAVAGTSAGAMFGTLIVLGFSIDEIWDFLYCLDMKKIVNPNFFMLLKKCGIEDGQIIHNLFEEILTKKTGTKHINFKQLYKITKIHFTVVGSCLTTKKVVYYDHINTPNFKVSMAIRISISIPGFFTPVTIDNNKYIDGGVLNNYPINLFLDKLDETVGILICSEFNTSYKYPEEYPMAIMNLFMYGYYQKHMDQFKNNTIYIKENPKNVNVFNFNIDNKTKIELYNNGINAAKKFIENMKK